MIDMTFRMIWPLWAILLVLGPALLLCGWAWWHAHRAPTSDGGGSAWLRRGAMVLLTGIIGLTPAMPADTEEVATAADVFIVVDRTGSMVAEDYDDGRPRLEGVRHDIDQILTAFPGARFSVIAFDSQPTRVVPLTNDTRALRSWTETLRQEITHYSAGTSIDRPLPEMETALANSVERNPGHVRLVFFLSDGENTDGDLSDPQQQRSFAPLAGDIDAGAVLGYGTAEGGQMRSYDGTADSGPGTDAPWIIDPATDEPAISRLDEANLQRVAEEMGLPYRHRHAPEPLDDAVTAIDIEEIAEDGRRDVETYRDVTWPFALLLVGLAGWEAFYLGGRLRRLKEVG
ncbi:vWA domain-containing protein [Bogoriella caseilytica]|uniref:Ca-activated chloride channel family protein n=1 Tax=Bogoriella caseilytica TaxID=56055 RepID=A0A3N2BBQ0_9MICO|nr:vWA domain-containing protein [Bogoriella caseilytica]ROR72693.1 Ca-activated chloride channel family protein [Bogoriella caseilytica]